MINKYNYRCKININMMSEKGLVKTITKSKDKKVIKERFIIEEWDKLTPENKYYNKRRHREQIPLEIEEKEINKILTSNEMTKFILKQSKEIDNLKEQVNNLNVELSNLKNQKSIVNTSLMMCQKEQEQNNFLKETLLSYLKIQKVELYKSINNLEPLTP